MQGENGKAEKPSHTPRGSLDAALPSPPPTPEQPKPAASAISCLNIFPAAKGSASDLEYEVVEPSKASSLKQPLPLPPLKNIGAPTKPNSDECAWSDLGFMLYLSS